jgi:Xaa-Pro dipeptidase
MALLDMGAEYHGYVSDITCSFPISGTFSDDQRAVFQGVLNAQGAVMQMMKPGVSWVDCHRAAEREILSALLQLGVLHNGTLEQLIEADICTTFMPHGLGHFIGCDTHDVGGYGEGSPARLPGFGVGKLRTSRILEAGMVLTNEPGCYFISPLIDAGLADPIKGPFLNEAVLARFRNWGGVRLEDVVLVSAEGQLPENLTTCPRTVEEIESVMKGGAWPPAADAAPQLYRRWTELAPGGEGMQDVHVPSI